MQEKSSTIKTIYSKLFQPSELELLDYESLTEGDEFDYIYKPNDDTFLMLSTLKHELKEFQPNLFVCQLGSGSGIISANLNNWLKNINKTPIIHISIDINMDASLFSQKYYNLYNLNINQINASLFNSFTFRSDSQQSKPEVIVFNPPYVPVQQEQLDNEQKYLVQKLKYVRQNKKTKREKDQNLIAYSYMGGLDGLAITRKILKQLTWNTTFYFIVMGEEGLNTIQQQISSGKALNSSHKFVTTFTVMQYGHFYNQHLFVVKLTLKKQ